MKQRHMCDTHHEYMQAKLRFVSTYSIANYAAAMVVRSRSSKNLYVYDVVHCDLHHHKVNIDQSTLSHEYHPV